MDDPAFATETDLQTQSIILAATNHDIPALRNLLRHTSANVQDPETGCTPLHAAIAACERDNETNGLASDQVADPGTGGPPTNGQGRKVNGSGSTHVQEAAGGDADLEAAVKTVRLLFENGAIWNDLDANGETPGCIARRLGLTVLYEMCVDAGVRAELLLARLDGYQVLGDEDSDGDDEEEGGGGGDRGSEDAGHTEERLADTTAAIALEDEKLNADADASTRNANYLSSNLTFDRNKIVDEAANGVMMRWETAIMKRSAELLAPAPGLRILNVGHGMGIIDNFFQESRPKSHHIVEAHPDVLSRLKDQGWDARPGVVIHAGRWQDVIPKLLEAGELFDAIYFDTFAEEYSALKNFFSECVIGLLDPQGGANEEGGRFGFFNGMGADRQICYDVYTKVVELDLLEAGFDVDWERIAVPDLDEAGEWEGVRRKYWAVEEYRLPTCTFIE